MADDRWWKDFDTVIASTIPAGSRILDVGCGDGGLVARLAGQGYDAVGVDPAAPDRPDLIHGRIEDVGGLGRFDAVTAVMALHHADLAAVVRTVADLLSPRGRLLVYDYSWDDYDERCARWIAQHDSSNSDTSVPEWRLEHDQLHPEASVQMALSESFRYAFHVRRPYLARMLAQHDLESEERALIDAQQLPALGYWTLAERL